MHDNVVYKNKWIILFAVILMSFMCCVDTNVVNVALPVISKKLDVTMANVEWIVTSYLMVICSFILIYGRLGDLKGKTKVFKFGIILFTIGSFLCSMSFDLNILIISRIIQAFGAAAAMANNQGIITHVFPSNERGKALGILGSAVAIGIMVGPALGGFILSAFNWNAIFLINVPIGIINLILAFKFLPKGNVCDEKLDVKGAILLAVGILLMFTAMILGQTVGFDNVYIILSFVISVFCLALFLVFQSKAEAPLLELKIFKNSLFSLGIFCGLISFVCISASSILQPFYLQDELNLSPSVAGLILMVSPLVLSIISPIIGNLGDKFGQRNGSELLSIIGLICTSIGLFLSSTLNENSSVVKIIIFLVIISFGNGFFQPSNNSLIMSTVSKDKLGIAGSINALVRNFGAFLGVAVATTLLYNKMSEKIGYRVTDFVDGRSDVFTYAMRYVYIVLAVVCLIGALISIYRMYNSKKHFSL